MRLGRLVGRVGLGEEQLVGDEPRCLDGLARIRVGDGARELERHPEVAIHADERRAAGVAMHHAANLVRFLFAQDPRRDIMRAQHVDDQRQLLLASGANVRSKQGLLPILVVGPTVEAGLADRDAIGRDEPGDEVIGFAGRELGYRLWMHAKREPHEVVLVRERAQATPGRRPNGRYENRFDASRPRTRNNFVAVAIEQVDVEVAMRIEHATAV